MDEKQYVFVAESEESGGQFSSVVKAHSLLEAMKKYTERYHGESTLFLVKCTELTFNAEGVADIFFEDED